MPTVFSDRPRLLIDINPREKLYKKETRVGGKCYTHRLMGSLPLARHVQITYLGTPCL